MSDVIDLTGFTTEKIEIKIGKDEKYYIPLDMPIGPYFMLLEILQQTNKDLKKSKTLDDRKYYPKMREFIIELVSATNDVDKKKLEAEWQSGTIEAIFNAYIDIQMDRGFLKNRKSRQEKAARIAAEKEKNH